MGCYAWPAPTFYLPCYCGSERRGVADDCSFSEAPGDYVGGATPAGLKIRAVSYRIRLKGLGFLAASVRPVTYSVIPLIKRESTVRSSAQPATRNLAHRGRWDPNMLRCCKCSPLGCAGGGVRRPPHLVPGRRARYLLPTGEALGSTRYTVSVVSSTATTRTSSGSRVPSSCSTTALGSSSSLWRKDSSSMLLSTACAPSPPSPSPRSFTVPSRPNQLACSRP